ncbi:hypothetical protein C2G38_2048228 [Gigaspora rosea]|uniref:SWIM-type domain-containing protein n=1 Tax=Gigaspora rosea TaxID=44941 RepID=A0A397U7F7_9GLOM|nr:hypothetical protein C2G38_2048228 [Gigaspora rosea]
MDELNNGNELEIFTAYESVDDADDFSDNSGFYSDEELTVGKTFQSWEHVTNFMKKYAAEKGHGHCTKSWAHAFTSKYFTAGVQTTSRNESENAALKRLFGSLSLSLCKLFDALEERYQEEIDYCKFVSWKQTMPQTGPKSAMTTIFEPVIRRLNEFVMPNIVKKQEEQMNLSFYYHAVEVDLEVIFSKEKEVDESEQCIDNLFDCPQIQLKSFLNEFFSTILEIWEVMHLLGSGISQFICFLDDGIFLCMCMLRNSHGYPCRHFYRTMTLTPTARFHIGLVNRRWYKEGLQETDISNNKFISVSPKTLASATKTHLLPAQFLHCEPNFIRAEEFTNCISNQSANEISKAISKKRKFGELWGLEKKIMVEAIEDSNEDIYHELLGFLMSIQRRTSQRTINETNNSVNDNINDDDHMMGIQNPIKKKPKGCPKSKRIKNAFEKPNTKTSYSQCHKASSYYETSSDDENINADENSSAVSNEEISITSTGNECVQELSGTIESGINCDDLARESSVVVLIPSSTLLINFQNCENTQRQCSVCRKKGHNARTCPNKN